MKDTFAATFESREAAESALGHLTDAGWDTDRLSIRRVMEHPEHRGFGDDEVAYSLIHAPQIPADSTVADDATIVLLLVDMPDDVDEEKSADEAIDVHDPATTRRALEEAGAAEVWLVEGSPPMEE